MTLRSPVACLCFPRCCCLPCCLLVWAGCSGCPSWAGCCCCLLLPALCWMAVGLLEPAAPLLGWLRPPARLLWCLLVRGAALRSGAGLVHFRAGGALPGGLRTGLCTLCVFAELPCPAWSPLASRPGLRPSPQVPPPGCPPSSSSSGKACIPTMGAAWFHVIPVCGTRP